MMKAQVSEMILQIQLLMSFICTIVVAEERFECSVSGILISAKPDLNSW